MWWSWSWILWTNCLTNVTWLWYVTDQLHMRKKYPSFPFNCLSTFGCRINICVCWGHVHNQQLVLINLNTHHVYNILARDIWKILLDFHIIHSKPVHKAVLTDYSRPLCVSQANSNEQNWCVLMLKYRLYLWYFYIDRSVQNYKIHPCWRGSFLPASVHVQTRSIIPPSTSA